MCELGVLETFMDMPIVLCARVRECRRMGRHLESLHVEAPFTEVSGITQRKSWYVCWKNRLIEPQEILQLSSSTLAGFNNIPVSSEGT